MGECGHEWYGVLESATRSTWCWREAEAHEWCNFISGKAICLNLSMVVLGALLGSNR